MKIAIDAMGGDRAPQAPIKALRSIARQFPDSQFALLGDGPLLSETLGTRLENVEIVHAPTVIESGEDPVRSVRRKPDSSLAMCATMVRNGAADAMISAGNTGALVAAGMLTIGRMANIDRPALAPVLPTFDGKGVLLLDAGATMDASALNLVQFARMGEAYSRYVLGVNEPRIALVNVGSEEGKGNAVVKEAYERIRNIPGIRFVGNVEGRELLDGSCDVAVCDGFVGNVVLKIIEGTGLGFFGVLREMMLASAKNKLAAMLLKPSFVQLKKRFDYAEYGGSPFLGVAGGLIKAHGSSGERAWVTALRQSIRFVEQDMVNKLSQSLEDPVVP